MADEYYNPATGEMVNVDQPSVLQQQEAVLPQQDAYVPQQVNTQDPIYMYFATGDVWNAAAAGGSSAAPTQYPASAPGSSGVAPALGGGDGASKWFDEKLAAMKDYFGKDDQTGVRSAALLTVGGSFLQGLFGAKRADRAAASQEKLADASMMNAQSNAQSVTNKSHGSSIGATNFGAAPKGLMYANRRKISPIQQGVA